MIAIIARILGVATLVYMFICAARVLMSWIPGIDSGRGGMLIKAAADPYLGLFRKIKALSGGAFDFSPIVALAALAVANELFMRLAAALGITLGLVLALILSAAWSVAAFLLSFLAVCAVARLIAYAARWNSLHPLWRVVDTLLNPVLFRINRLIYRGRIVNYLQGLITGLIVFIALYLAGGQLIALAGGLLLRLPV